MIEVYTEPGDTAKEVLFLCSECGRPMQVIGARLAFGQWLGVKLRCNTCATRKE